jgi:hypothetical protein
MSSIALWFCLDGPVEFSIGPFVIQDANQPFPQVLHRGRQLAVGLGDGSSVELELNQEKRLDEAHLGRFAFDRQSRFGDFQADQVVGDRGTPDFLVYAIDCFSNARSTLSSTSLA